MKTTKTGMTREEELIRLVENCRMKLARIGDPDKAEVERLVRYSVELDRMKRNAG